MAKVREFDEANWNEWVASRPESVRELCQSLPPDRLYRMGSTGHRCTIHSYGENGTVTVTVSGDYNAVTFARNVFGIKPEELTECDLPDESEVTGELLTDGDEIQSFIEGLRDPVHTDDPSDSGGGDE